MEILGNHNVAAPPRKPSFRRTVLLLSTLLGFYLQSAAAQHVYDDQYYARFSVETVMPVGPGESAEVCVTVPQGAQHIRPDGNPGRISGTFYARERNGTWRSCQAHGGACEFGWNRVTRRRAVVNNKGTTSCTGFDNESDDRTREVKQIAFFRFAANRPPNTPNDPFIASCICQDTYKQLVAIFEGKAALQLRGISSRSYSADELYVREVGHHCGDTQCSNWGYVSTTEDTGYRNVPTPGATLRRNGFVTIESPTFKPTASGHGYIATGRFSSLAQPWRDNIHEKTTRFRRQPDEGLSSF